jgi:hypothetical protein
VAVSAAARFHALLQCLHEVDDESSMTTNAEPQKIPARTARADGYRPRAFDGDEFGTLQAVVRRWDSTKASGSRFMIHAPTLLIQRLDLDDRGTVIAADPKGTGIF